MMPKKSVLDAHYVLEKSLIPSIQAQTGTVSTVYQLQFPLYALYNTLTHASSHWDVITAPQMACVANGG